MSQCEGQRTSGRHDRQSSIASFGVKRRDGPLQGQGEIFDCQLKKTERFGRRDPCRNGSQRASPRARVWCGRGSTGATAALLRLSGRAVSHHEGHRADRFSVAVRTINRLRDVQGLRVGLDRTEIAGTFNRNRDIEGWGFCELDKVDPARGGAPRAHVDAMRCLPSSSRTGITSQKTSAWCVTRRTGRKGPHAQGRFSCCKMSAQRLARGRWTWRRGKRWGFGRTARPARSRCESCRTAEGRFAKLAYEDGSQFLGRSLSQLSERQLSDLFVTARFHHHGGPLNRTRPVADWVRVFKGKVTAITAGPPCPSTQEAQGREDHKATSKTPRAQMLMERWFLEFSVTLWPVRE